MENDETILLAAANGQEKYDEVIDKLFSNPKIVAPDPASSDTGIQKHSD